MKSLIVRLSVAALALTGFAASTLISHSTKVEKHSSVVADAGTGPAPMCWPDGVHFCGMR